MGRSASCTGKRTGRLLTGPCSNGALILNWMRTEGGLIRVRPTTADALFDLKPHEELAARLPGLADLIRREIQRASESEGVSPFARESFEPILSAAGVRLDDQRCYAPDKETTTTASAASVPTRLTMTDRWALFARTR